MGRTTRKPDELKFWFKSFVDYQLRGPQAFFWGRIPLNVLVNFFIEFHGHAPDQEFVDLCAPFRASGSGSTHDTNCAALLANAASHPPSGCASTAKVSIAIVDLGDDKRAPPDDYGGKLRHAVTGAGLSDHAEMVLSVLLDRLQHNGILADATISCGLVTPPKAGAIAIGRSCFEQASTAEMLDAIKALDPLLTADKTPAAINMSLGTHVGPHNGVSPLEEYISGTFTAKNRFLVVAAGNEDRFSCAAKRDLKANQEETMTLSTGPLCKEVLVEFWWNDATVADLSIEAEVWEVNPAHSRSNIGTIKIDKGRGTALARARAGLPASVVAHSLFAAKCQKDFSCIAFAMSETSGAPLPNLQIFFTLKAIADVTVNAWIVVAEPDPLTALSGGGPVGTITVPATDASVLSVAGLEDATGKIWKGSSRGPAAQYASGAPATSSPLMAHLAALGTDFGTSFASPRACADVAAALADPTKLPHCTDATSLMIAAYGLTPPLPAWNARTGRHKAT